MSADSEMLRRRVAQHVRENTPRALAELDRQRAELTDAELRELLVWAMVSLRRAGLELVGEWADVAYLLTTWIDDREAARAMDRLIRECGGDPGPDALAAPE